MYIAAPYVSCTQLQPFLKPYLASCVHEIYLALTNRKHSLQPNGGGGKAIWGLAVVQDRRRPELSNLHKLRHFSTKAVRLALSMDLNLHLLACVIGTPTLAEICLL